MSSKVVIRDEVTEWNWWTRLPNIVLSKVDDPYELALLFVIRKVAGDDPEDGVCYMGTRALAEITKMGVSTVKRKIHSLAEKGLIKAELKKAPRGWKVWHITVPRSLWEENEKAYKELAQRQPEVVQEGSSGPETTQEVAQRQPETGPEITPTKNHTTKNPFTKKVSVYKKDKEGRYLDRSPQEICEGCGQYDKSCYCVPEGSRGKELDAATL